MTAILLIYRNILRRMVLGMAIMAGGGITGMMLVTCADVTMRASGRPIKGAYDIVRLLGLLTLVGALPYTTAVKGHVAVEFFFHKLPRIWQLIIDAVMRITTIGLFGLLSYQSWLYAMRLRLRGDVMATLPIPFFLAPVTLSVALALVVLVIIEQLVRPSKPLISP